MKIVNKMHLNNAVNLGLLVVVGIFALHSFDQLLMKFRFAEIADDLNTAFLEMRLAEKNYILYGDTDSLHAIKQSLSEAVFTIGRVEEDIVLAVGRANHDRLKALLTEYSRNVYALPKARQDRAAIQQLSESGQRLRIFSKDITTLERAKVATIIENSKSLLVHSFWSVVVFAFIFSHFSARTIRRSLSQIVTLTRSIAKGNYQAIRESSSADELGSVTLAINAMADELNRREQAIIQSKRLASIGVLVAGVAHELNNPLNNISMIAQTFLEVYDNLPTGQRLEFMRQIEEETERLRLTIKNLLDFSRPKEQHLASQSINEVVQKALGLVQNMLAISNLRAQLALADSLPNLLLDEHQIQQVLVNMMINAIQAMRPGGTLTVAIRLFRRPEDEEVVEVDDFFPKPVKIKDLKASIKRALGQ